jgi:hypothetical protein
MSDCNYQLNSALCFGSNIPIPESLQSKDKRADSAARVAVISATCLIEMIEDVDLSSLNVIVVSREGCVSHIEKVSSGIAKRVAAQGFFVRGGPQTLATYTALALGAHGAAFTLVGEQSLLKDAISVACFLANTSTNSSAVLTVVKLHQNMGYKARSVFIKSTKNYADCEAAEEKILSGFAEVFNQGI